MFNLTMNSGVEQQSSQKLDALQQLKDSEVKLILSAIRFGDMAAFDSALMRLFKVDWLEHKGSVLGRINMPGGSTVLHQAAMMKKGSLDIVKFICETAPFLMCKMNVEGDTVWHIAVRDCSCAVFDILYSQREALISNKLMDNCDSSCDKVNINGEFCGLEDLSLEAANLKTGNTALHEALLNGNRMAAGKLFVADMESCYKVNREKKSPLYISAELGDIVLFNNMVRYAGTSPGGLEKLAKGKSIVRVAISKKLKGSLSLMWDIDPHLFELTDDDEKAEESALSFLTEGTSKLQTRSIGPFIVNFEALLALKNDDIPAPNSLAHHSMLSNIERLKRPTSVAISRGKAIAQNSKFFRPRKNSDLPMTDGILIFSAFVVLFSFVLTRISSLDFQPLYGINIFVLCITLFGTSALCLVRISGNRLGLTEELISYYLLIVTIMAGLLTTLLVNLLIKKLLYVVAFIALTVIVPIFLVKSFLEVMIKRMRASRRSKAYSVQPHSKTRYFEQDNSKHKSYVQPKTKPCTSYRQEQIRIRAR